MYHRVVSKVLPGAAAADGPQPDATRQSAVRGLVRAARPKQWAKNVLVFAAPGAAGVLSHGTDFLRALAAFLLFCLVSSGVYLLNDTVDARADREHPTKRFRPIAAGIVSRRTAVATAVVLMGIAIGGGTALHWRLGLVLGIYVLVQLAYSLYLKHLPIFDLVSVAAGFVLRAIAGAVAIPVPVSQWFLIVATFGSLLMVTGKRVAEHTDLGEGRGAHRATLDVYSPTFLRTVLGIAAGGAAIGYALWAFSLQTAAAHHHDPIWYQLSTVPVFIALLRYTFLVEAGHGAKPEELVLADRPLQVLGACWVFLFVLAIYG